MRSIRRQQGYLAVIVGLMIAVVAFTSLVTSYQFTNKALAVGNTMMGMQAYYLAYSGIERAKYDLTVNELGCTAINGTANYTNATFPNAAGTFTVTGASTQISNTLSAAVTNVATTIPLTSSTGFATAGTILIDSELITYTAISGNNLTGAIRGVGGSAAAAHVILSVVSQNQCLLTSTGRISTTTPAVQRIVQGTLIANSFSPGQNSSGAGSGAGSAGGAGAGMFQTTMAIGGSVSLANGATITNSSVQTTSANFPGSTIMSGGPVVINGSGQTRVSNGSGGFVTASSAGNIQSDISSNNSQMTSSNLWNNFFTQSKATVQASANQSYNSSNINGVTGTTIWTSDLSLNSNTTIGSMTSPVILIVNGNLNTSATLTIYGLLYVMNGAAMNGTTTVNGLFGTEGAFNSNGTTNIVYNPGILTRSGSINTNSSRTYSIVPSSVQERFP